MDESKLSLITIYSTVEESEGLIQFLEKVPTLTGFAYLLYINGLVEDALECSTFLKINQATSMKVWQAAPGIAVRPNHLYILSSASPLSISGGIFGPAVPVTPVQEYAVPVLGVTQSVPLLVVVPATLQNRFAAALEQVRQASGKVLLVDAHRHDRTVSGYTTWTPDEAAREIVRQSGKMAKEVPASNGIEGPLMHQRQLIDKITNTTPDIIYLLDLQKKSILYANERAVEILGHPSTEYLYKLRSKVFREILHPDDFLRRMEHINACTHLKPNEIKEIEVRLKVADGSWRWFKVRDRAFQRAEDGTVLQTIGIVQDIQDRKEALDKLREEHMRFSNAEALGHIGSFERILPHSTLTCSDEFYRIHGLEPKSMVFDMEKLLSFVHPEDQKGMREQLWATHTHDKPLDLYQRLIRVDGSVRRVHVRADVVRDERGKPLKLYGTIQDITELKQAQEEAEKNKSLMEAVFNESLSEMMVLLAVRNDRDEIIDFEYRLLNHTAYAMAGQDLTGKRYLELNPQDRSSGLFDLFRRVVETGEPADMERSYIGSGFRNWFRITAVKLDDGVVLTVEDITKRKEAEEENQQTTKLLRDIFEGIQVQISYLKPLYDEQGNPADFMIILTNDEDLCQQGPKRIQSLSCKFSELFPGYHQHELWEGLKETYLTGQSRRFETWYGLDGLDLWIDVSIVKHESGLIYSSQIINDRKKAEESLTKTLSIFHRAEEVGALGSYEADLDTMTFHFSDNLFRLFGEEPSAFVPTLDYIDAHSHPDDIPVVKNILEEAILNRQPYTYSRRIYLPNGQMRYLHAQGVVMTDQEDRPVKLLGTIQDITERVRSEETFQHMLSGSIAAIVLLEAVRNEQGVIIDFVYKGVNEAASRITGVPIEEMLGKRFLELSPAAREVFFDIYVEVVETGEMQRLKRAYPYEQFDKDTWFDATAVKHEDGIIMTFLDITEQKRAEEELRRREQSIQNLLNLLQKAPDAYIVLSPDYFIIMASDAYLEATLAKRQDTIGKNLFEVFPDNPATPKVNAVKNLRASLDQVLLTKKPHRMSIQRYDVHRPAEQGGGFEEKYWSPVNIPVLNSEGEVAYIIHRVIDVTEAIKNQGEIKDLARQTQVLASTLAELDDKTAQLEESRNLLQSIFDTSPGAITVLKSIYADNGEIVDFEILNVSNFTTEITGQSSQELIGKQMAQEFPHVREQGMLDEFKRTALTGEPADFERWYEGDGIQLWLHFRTRKINDLLIVATEDITERKRAEEQILDLKDEVARKATDKYLTLFNAIDEGFYLTEVIFDEHNQPLDIRLLEENPAARRIIGSSLIGKTLREVNPNYEEYWYQLWSNVALTGQSNRLEQYSNLDQRWFSFYITKVGDESSRQVAVVFRDVTKRKNAEMALRESEERFRNLVEAYAQAVWETNAEGEVVTDSPSWRASTGQTYEEWIGYGWLDAFHPDDREHAQRQWREAVAARQNVTAEFRIKNAKGEYRWTKVRATPIRDKEGTITKWVGMNIDIHNRKLIEEALRRNEDHLSAIFSQAEVGLSEISMDGRFIRVNDTLCRILGRSREELLTLGIPEVTFVDDIPASFEVVQKLIKSGQPDSLEKRYIRSDGSIVWSNSSLSLIRTGEDKALSILAVTVDITERKKAEEALRQSEEEFRLFVTASSDLVYKMSPDWSQMYSLDGKNVLADTVDPSGNWLPRYIMEEDQPQVMAAIQEAILNKKMFELEHRVIRQDGTVGWAFSRAVPVLNERGEITQWLGAVRDVTLRKTAELQLQAFNTVLEQQVAERTSALKQSKERLEAAIHVSPMVLSVLKSIRNDQNEIIDFYVDWVSRSGEQMVGKDVSGLRLLEEFPYLIKYGIVDEFIRTVETDSTTDYEYLYEEGGYYIWVRWKAVKLGDGLFAAVEDITERKKAGLLIEEQAHFISSVTETMPDMISVMEYPSRQLKYINQEPYTLQGFDADDMRRMSPEELEQLMHPDDIPATNEYFGSFATLPNDQIASYEYRARTKSGEWQWFRVRGRVFERDEEGRVKAVLNVVQNVNEQKKAADEIKKSHERIQAMFEAIPLHLTYSKVVRGDQDEVVDFTLEIINQVNLERTGLTRDDIGKPLTLIRPGIEKLPFWESMLRVAETGEPITEETFYDAHGYKGWILASIVPFMEGVLVAALNIDDRIKAERERLKQLTILKQSEEVAQLGSWEYDVVNDSLTWSDGMYHLFEMERGLPVSLETYDQFVVEEDRQKMNTICQSLRRGEVVTDETIRLQIGKNQKCIKLRSNALTTENGRATSILGIDLDVTEAVEAELQLRQLTENLQIVLESSPAYIGYFKAVRNTHDQVVDFRLAVCNGRLAGYLHQPIEQLIGTSHRELVEYLWQDRTYEVLHEVLTTGNHLYEERHSLRNGEDHWLGISVLKQDDGVVVTGLNVTKLRQAEQQEKYWMQELERSNETLATLEEMRQYIRMRGEFLRTTSHDLRGSFGVIVGATSLLDMMNTEEERTQTLDMLRRSLKQVSHMMNQLLDFSRLESGQEELHVAPFDAAELLIELSESVRPLAQDKKLWVKDEGPGRLLVESDIVKVRRIVQNLLLNAIKYTSKGGVRISWGQESEDSTHWQLVVGDTGPGLSQQLINQLMGVASAEEPDEKWHEPEEQDESLRNYGNRASGEGIGLIIVKRLCELMHAELAIESTPRVGTVFRIRFPKRYTE
ncbi:PAS domain S-box protein [Telluribacter sp. SYSU D00476]|uniref:PAS domain S-box protein n=1 Tax=Telluribacter sp. SYSU D00476 TaxID=2811430 RepID=UPI001FF2116D|nr:PAS domain S-box protein [Telluribacter sp. SYSU D00476]